MLLLAFRWDPYNDLIGVENSLLPLVPEVHP